MSARILTKKSSKSATHFVTHMVVHYFLKIFILSSYGPYLPIPLLCGSLYISLFPDTYTSYLQCGSHYGALLWLTLGLILSHTFLLLGSFFPHNFLVWLIPSHTITVTHSVTDFTLRTSIFFKFFRKYIKTIFIHSTLASKI